MRKPFTSFKVQGKAVIPRTKPICAASAPLAAIQAGIANQNRPIGRPWATYRMNRVNRRSDRLSAIIHRPGGFDSSIGTPTDIRQE